MIIKKFFEHIGNDRFESDCESIIDLFLLYIADEYNITGRKLHNSGEGYRIVKIKADKSIGHYEYKNNRLIFNFNIKLNKILSNSISKDRIESYYNSKIGQYLHEMPKDLINYKFITDVEKFISRIKSHFQKDKNKDESDFDALLKTITKKYKIERDISSDDIENLINFSLKDRRTDEKMDSSLKFILTRDVDGFWVGIEIIFKWIYDK